MVGIEIVKLGNGRGNLESAREPTLVRRGSVVGRVRAHVVRVEEERSAVAVG